MRYRNLLLSKHLRIIAIVVGNYRTHPEQTSGSLRRISIYQLGWIARRVPDTQKQILINQGLCRTYAPANSPINRVEVTMKVLEALAKAIAAEGVDHIFAVMGDANQDFIVELCEKHGVKL